MGIQSTKATIDSNLRPIDTHQLTKHDDYWLMIVEKGKR